MHPVVLVEHLGLFLIGAFFVWGGLNHFRIFGAMKAMLAERRWPAPGAIVVAASVWEAGWGAVLASGFQTVMAALALMLFVIIASVTLLDFWNQEGEARDAALSAFMSNLALVGGLMVAATLA